MCQFNTPKGVSSECSVTPQTRGRFFKKWSQVSLEPGRLEPRRCRFETYTFNHSTTFNCLVKNMPHIDTIITPTHSFTLPHMPIHTPTHIPDTHAHTHAHTHSRHTCPYTRPHTSRHTCPNTCLHTLIPTYIIRTCSHIHSHTYTHTQVHIHSHTSTHTPIHKYTYIHPHTSTHTLTHLPHPHSFYIHSWPH